MMRPCATALCQKIAGYGSEIAQRIVAVRVVHDYGERLARIHALEAAGHRDQDLINGVE